MHQVLKVKEFVVVEATEIPKLIMIPSRVFQRLHNGIFMIASSTQRQEHNNLATSQRTYVKGTNKHCK